MFIVIKLFVPHKTLRAPNFGDTVKRIPPARYFSAVAFGRNVFLCCHRDEDFTMSMVHILLEGKDGYNKLDDDVIVFFSQLLVLRYQCGQAIFCYSIQGFPIASPLGVVWQTMSWLLLCI